MTDKPDKYARTFALALSRKLASVFEDAILTYKLIPFVETFIKSDLFSHCFSDETVFSQSKKYIIELFNEELTIKQIQIPLEDARYDKDVAYWIGYILADWYQLHGLDMNVLSHEDIVWLYDGYDTFHTQDVEYE